MKYVGSKDRHGKDIYAAVLKDGPVTHWYEPFVGGANMMQHVPEDVLRVGIDINEHMIALLNKAVDGWVAPIVVTEAEYRAAMADPDSIESHLLAFIAVGCSYSGKWFGGYARGDDAKGNPRNYARESSDALARKAKRLKGAHLLVGDYRIVIPPPDAVVYCDPPYKGTTGYKSGRFDSAAFWDWCDRIARTNRIYVSEYEAPPGWAPVWEKKVTSSLTKNTGHKTAVEKLWRRIPCFS